jgi:plastocyanin domain-containing protein
MNNKIILGFIVLLVLGAGIFFIKSPVTGNASKESSGEVQKIVLSYKNYNYFPNTITVKVDQPVRIYLDGSIKGCYRSFTIKDFGIAKNLKTPEDYVEFTPNKKGTYKFACSMGMGTGTIIVE